MLYLPVAVRDRRKKEALVKTNFTKTKILPQKTESPTTDHTVLNLSQQEESPRWAAYHTKTGRTTAQYEELRRTRDHHDDDPSWVRHPSPWKPAFELQPLFKPNGCSTPRTSPPLRQKSPSTTSTRSPNVSPHLPTAGSPDRRVKFNEQDDVTLFKHSIHFTHTIDLPSSSTEQHKQLPDFAKNSETEKNSPIMAATQQTTSCKTGTECSAVPHYRLVNHLPIIYSIMTPARFHVAEKNFERKTMLGERCLVIF